MFQPRSKELTGQKSKGKRKPQRGKSNTGVAFALRTFADPGKLEL